MKKLYLVELITTAVVVAEDEFEARDYADEAARDYDPNVEVDELRYLPADWDEDSLPYGYMDPNNPDKTVQQWIDEGAAPMYKVNMRTKKCLTK